MSLYLALKEVWRNKSRFLLFSLVIALITILVIFIAGLGEGLAAANKEYLEKLNGELIVFQENVKLSTTSSRIGRSSLNDIQRVPGVKDIGPIGFSAASIVLPAGEDSLDVALIGVEPGRPGEPPALEGNGLRSNRAMEVVIDGNVSSRTGIRVGDAITIKSIQGTEEEFYSLNVIGRTDGRQYFFQPSIFVPFLTWDKIRPQGSPSRGESELLSNVVIVQLEDPQAIDQMAGIIETQVSGVEVVDKVTAYEATPGYEAQQSTLNTQRGFTLLIGVLVIGGFFQIQTLQKVPRIGMLKAIGASNSTVALAVVLQILVVTVLGILIGALGTYALSFGLPASIPISFTGRAAAAAIGSLLVIGPIGGLVSVRVALKVEPLLALGLSS